MGFFAENMLIDDSIGSDSNNDQALPQHHLITSAASVANTADQQSTHSMNPNPTVNHSRPEELEVKLERTSVSENNGRTVTQYAEAQQMGLSPSQAASISYAYDPSVSPARLKPLDAGTIMAGNLSETSTPSELSNPTVTSSVTSNSSVFCPIQPTSICTVLGTKPTLSTPRTTDAKLFISLHSSIGTSPENSMGAQSTQGPIPKGEPDIKKRLEPAEVVIFNNAIFDNNNEFQLGSNDDIGLLESTFSALKCKVTIFSDATVSDIRSNMQKLEVKSFEDRSAVVLVVLSHCHQYETIAAKDGYYNLDTEIIFPLLRNETLINKPKMLFVQAGRGSRELLRYRTDTNSNKCPQLYAAPSDILKCYCTYEDSKSCQNTSGTSFIRELCNTLSSHPNVDIESNVKSVSKCVMASTRKSQVPLMTSTMTRKYSFGDYI